MYFRFEEKNVVTNETVNLTGVRNVLSNIKSAHKSN